MYDEIAVPCDGYDCTACVMRLEGLEDDLPGVRRVKASYQKSQASHSAVQCS